MSAKSVAVLILCAALAGCARPAATPTPPATAVAADPARTATPTPRAPGTTASPAPSATPTPAPTPTPSAAVVRGPAWVPPGVTSAIVVYTRAFEYAPAARPAGMDDPTRGCDALDEGRRVILLTATLRIYNRSHETMRDWYAYFADAAGEALYTCHQGFPQMPDLPPGYYVDVTFGAFAEGMSKVRGYVYDRAVGRSNEVEF